MRKLMQTDFEEIKETNIQLPSSRREIEEDMLEQICLIANAGAEITVEELCGRMNMSRRAGNCHHCQHIYQNRTQPKINLTVADSQTF